MMEAEIVRDGPNVGLLVRQVIQGSTAESTRRVLLAAQYVAGIIADTVRRTFTKRPRGDLARSFRPSPIEINGAEVSSRAFSDSQHARIHDEGGTIYPRVMKSLAVPIEGAPIPIGKWPRHFGKGELTLIPRPGKPALLVKVKTRKLGKGKSGPAAAVAMTPMFVLVPSVEIEGRHYIEAARKDAEPGVVHILDEGVIKAINEAESKS